VRAKKERRGGSVGVDGLLSAMEVIAPW
jgi:hypothetical protein